MYTVHDTWYTYWRCCCAVLAMLLCRFLPDAQQTQTGAVGTVNRTKNDPMTDLNCCRDQLGIMAL